MPVVPSRLPLPCAPSTFTEALGKVAVGPGSVQILPRPLASCVTLRHPRFLISEMEVMLASTS